MGNIIDLINSGKYNNKLEFPKRTQFVCPNCNLIISKVLRTGSKINNFCSNCGFDVKKYIDEDVVKFKDKMLAYNLEDQRLHNEFVRDALIHVGLLYHPKGSKIFSLAWEYGHASGLSNVISILDDLAELFRD